MNYVFRYNVPAIVTACVLPSALYALTAAFTAFRLMRKTVIDMLNNTGKDGKAIHILRKARIKIPAKMRIRSIAGHPGRSFVTLLGVIVASVCLMLGLVMRDSIPIRTKPSCIHRKKGLRQHCCSIRTIFRRKTVGM